ncbi:hypothetical protein AGMMS50293_08090 [Spirochaetia bacterium]|nr:hypothetical protein AGMMS50293_08090 [Spirochaetia bacterium]
MTIQQTIDVPVSHQLTIDVPREVPEGPVVLTFTPKPKVPGRKPVSRHFGRLKNSKAFAGDPMEIQRQMRAEAGSYQ